MEVDGKEFLRNVGIEQDKERLTQEQQRLEELKRASVKREENYMDMDMDANENDSAFVDLSIGNDSSNKNNDVDNIILDTSNVNNNKKKYIMLGFGLVLLFIITVLVIRLISNSDTENQLEQTSPMEKTEITKDEILNKIDSNEEYQKVIDRKKTLKENTTLVKKQEKTLNDLEIPQQEVTDNVPLVIDTPKPKIEPKRDLFGLDKENKNSSESIVKKVTKSVKKTKAPVKQVSKPKKATVLPSVKETNFTKKAASKGYFIQIGAFTKTPNKNLLKSIVNKGYKYKIHKLTIKGKLYNKVLIGPFKNRTEATGKLSSVKIDFKNPNAYILKF